jgi:hypothetical protein
MRSGNDQLRVGGGQMEKDVAAKGISEDDRVVLVGRHRVYALLDFGSPPIRRVMMPLSEKFQID